MVIKMEHALIDDLIRLKLRRDEAAAKPIEINIASLGKAMTFTMPTRDQQLDFIGAIRGSAGGNFVEKAYPAYRQLVYDCCPLLHDANLHSELGVIDPYDAVDKLFAPLEVMEIGDRLTERFGSIQADIKN